MLHSNDQAVLKRAGEVELEADMGDVSLAEGDSDGPTAEVVSVDAGMSVRGVKAPKALSVDVPDFVPATVRAKQGFDSSSWMSRNPWVVVKGIPMQASEDDIRSKMEEFGVVSEVQCYYVPQPFLRDLKPTSKKKRTGYAFVEFASSDGARMLLTEAPGSQRLKLEDCMLTVEERTRFGLTSTVSMRVYGCLLPCSLPCLLPRPMPPPPPLLPP